MNNFIFRLQQMNKRMENAFIQMFKEMFQTMQESWRKYSPPMYRELKRFGKFTTVQVSKGWKQSWNWFVSQTIDRRIAIVVSVLVTTALMFGKWHWFTIICMIFAVIVAWSIVYRKYTGPAIHDSSIWVWKTTKPSRDAFGKWLSSVLYGEHGLPIAMIGWGVVSFLLFWLTFYFSKEVATFFGMVGWCGVISGTLFYAVELHNKYKTKQPTKTTKTKPHLYRGPRKTP